MLVCSGALGVLAGGCADASSGRPGQGAALVAPALAGGAVAAPVVAPVVVEPRSRPVTNPFLLAGRTAGQGVSQIAAAAPAADETVIVPPPPQFDAPAAEAAAPPAMLTQSVPVTGGGRAGGTWAVVIGVNDYPGRSSDLRSAVNDANDMEQALATMGVPAERRLVLRNTQASADVIRAAADWLVANAGPDALAVFFFSGHVRKLGPTTEAMIGADGNVVADNELAGRLSGLAARRAWIVVAACYGGGFTEVLSPGRILTGAAPAQALAYESSLYGRSYLVQYMIREAIIERRAPGSVQAAFAYATNELARKHPGRLPVQIDLSQGPLELAATAAAGTPAAAIADPSRVALPGTPAPPPPTPLLPSPAGSNCLLIICTNPTS